MITKRKGTIIEADIHGMTADEAHRELVRLLDRIGGDVTAVHVIHGYRRGDALKSMVQHRLRHPRISYKQESLLNEGETKLILKKRGNAQGKY